MTTEQKLKAIVAAQVKGSYGQWAFIMSSMDHETGDILPRGQFYSRRRDMALGHETRLHVLEILLDPRGLRAAYGGEDYAVCRRCLSRSALNCHCYAEADGELPEVVILFEEVPQRILDTWLSSNGDAAKTIDTAYSLLPSA